MDNSILEDIKEIGKNSYEITKDLYTINTNIAGQLFEQQLALFSLGTEYTTRQLKLASEAKGYKEVISGQSEITSDISNKTQGIARNATDILNESKDELGTWFEKSVKQTENNIKKMAKAVPYTKAA